MLFAIICYFTAIRHFFPYVSRDTAPNANAAATADQAVEELNILVQC